MIAIQDNKILITTSDQEKAESNIIRFPLRPSERSNGSAVPDDPDIIITTEDGRRLDKLGMSADECCYILPPRVSVISLERHEPDASSGSAGATSPGAMPVRVILSESDAVSEIGMDNECGSGPHNGREQPTHWLVPGRTLFLARQSPHDVAMLSIKLKMVAGLPPQK